MKTNNLAPAGNINPIKPNFKGKKILWSLSKEFLREKTGKDGH